MDQEAQQKEENKEGAGVEAVQSAKDYRDHRQRDQGRIDRSDQRQVHGLLLILNKGTVKPFYGVNAWLQKTGVDCCADRCSFPFRIV